MSDVRAVLKECWQYYSQHPENDKRQHMHIANKKIQ